MGKNKTTLLWGGLTCWVATLSLWLLRHNPCIYPRNPYRRFGEKVEKVCHFRFGYMSYTLVSCNAPYLVVTTTITHWYDKVKFHLKFFAIVSTHARGFAPSPVSPVRSPAFWAKGDAVWERCGWV